MILVNGSKGIGTGFSTDIMCYNPLEVIEYIKNKLLKIELEAPTEFIPYYEGFKGTISKINTEKFLVKGVYEKIGGDKIKVTELPVGFWTEDFKELLEGLIEPGVDKEGKKITATIKDYDDMSKDTNVDFTITLAKGRLEELEASKGDYGCNGLEKLLKLYTTNTTTNMHLFDAKDVLHKYENVTEIIDAYYETRLELYGIRKKYLLSVLEKELVLLSNKARYIQENLNDTIDLRKKKREQVTAMLEAKAYDKIDGDEDYKYLVKMPMDSVTEENVAKLLKEKESKESELDVIRNTTIQKMWLQELNKLNEVYLEYKGERERLLEGSGGETKKKVVKKGSTIKKSKEIAGGASV